MEFINEYQRQHYEACKRADADSRKHHLSSEEMRQRALERRALVCKWTMGEKGDEVEAMEFINDYQRRHYEACKRAQENSRKLHLSSAEMRSIAHAHREMVRASRMGERL